MDEVSIQAILDTKVEVYIVLLRSNNMPEEKRMCKDLEKHLIASLRRKETSRRLRGNRDNNAHQDSQIKVNFYI